MPISQTVDVPIEEPTPDGLDLTAPANREFVDHLISLLALEYVDRMRCTSDPPDLAAWEASAEITDIRRDLK